MIRLHQVKGVNAQIMILDEHIEQAASELSMLTHIDDDAQRDAIVSGNYEDQAEAKMTSGDVARLSKQIRNLEKDRAKLVAKRDRLIAKLASR